MELFFSPLERGAVFCRDIIEIDVAAEDEPAMHQHVFDFSCRAD